MLVLLARLLPARVERCEDGVAVVAFGLAQPLRREARGLLGLLAQHLQVELRLRDRVAQVRSSCSSSSCSASAVSTKLVSASCPYGPCSVERSGGAKRSSYFGSSLARARQIRATLPR